MVQVQNNIIISINLQFYHGKCLKRRWHFHGKCAVHLKNCDFFGHGTKMAFWKYHTKTMVHRFQYHHIFQVYCGKCKKEGITVVPEKKNMSKNITSA